MRCFTRQQRNAGASSSAGEGKPSTSRACRCISLNLSTSRPLFTPQKSAARQSDWSIKFRQNAPDCTICAYEWRQGRMETLIIGGALLTTPAQATVIRLFRSKPGSVPRQESITAGIGARKVVAPMARKSFAIFCLLGNRWKKSARKGFSFSPSYMGRSVKSIKNFHPAGRNGGGDSFCKQRPHEGVVGCIISGKVIR